MKSCRFIKLFSIIIMGSILFPELAKASPIVYNSWLSNGVAVSGVYSSVLTGSIETSSFYEINVEAITYGGTPNVGFQYSFSQGYRGTYKLFEGLYQDTSELPQAVSELNLGQYYNGSYSSLQAGYYTVALNAYLFQDTFRVSSPTYSFTMSGIGTPVTPVPETNTSAMLLTGLGLIGFIARRRKGFV